MVITLSIFGVGFAAFCVWLGVRIVNRRERWAKWTLAGTIGVPFAYLLSFGPYLAVQASQMPASIFEIGVTDPRQGVRSPFYSLVPPIMKCCPDWCAEYYRQYLALCAKEGFKRR